MLSIRYRRGSTAKRGPLPEIVSREFEIGWTAATLFLFAFLFWWATSADLGSLESYCIAMGRIRELERLLSAGFDAKLFRAQDKSMVTARQLAAELGLTPVSRARPCVRDNDNEDDDENPLTV